MRAVRADVERQGAEGRQQRCTRGTRRTPPTTIQLARSGPNGSHCGAEA